MRVQLAFMHFSDDHIRVAIDGNTAVDRAIDVAPDNERSGIAGFEYIEMPACAKIEVQSNAERISQDICLDPDTKSITVDAGPPLTLTQQTYFQGVD